MKLMMQQPLHLIPSPCLPCSDLASPILAPTLLSDISLLNGSEIMSLFGISVCCGDGDRRNTPCTAAGEQGLTSWSYQDLKPTMLPTEKEKLAAYEGVQATSGVAGREASSFDITAACPTLDVPRKHPLNTSHNQR